MSADSGYRRWRRVPLTVLSAGVAAASVAGSLAAARQGDRPLPTSARAMASAAPSGAPGASGSHASAAPGWQPAEPIDLSPLYAGPGVPEPTASSIYPGTPPPKAVPANSVKPTAPAPPGFADTLVGIYASEVEASKLPGQTPSLPPASEFRSALASLTPDQLSEVYDALQRAPGGVAGLQAALGHTTAGRKPGAAGDRTLAPAGLQPHQSPGTGQTFSHATTATTDEAGDLDACPDGAPGGHYGEDSINGAALAVDIAATAANSVPQSIVFGAFVLGEGAVLTIPDPVNITLQAIVAGGMATRDGFKWLQAIHGDCVSGAQEEQIGLNFENIDSLVELVDSRTTAIDNEEQLLYALVDARNTLILNKIAAIQASLNLELKVTIEEDLLQGTSGAVADLEVPASDGGYLDATPVGVQAIVTAALADEQRAGESVNPAAAGDLAAANAALGAGHDKEAFDDYGQAYREIVG